MWWLSILLPWLWISILRIWLFLKLILFSAVPNVSSFLSFAQQLKFKIDGLNDTTVFLGRYLGDRLYYADTSFSENGIVQFKKDNYKPGVYALICPGPSYFEFIMADKEVEMETTIGSFIPNMKVKCSIVIHAYMDSVQKKGKINDLIVRDWKFIPNIVRRKNPSA